MLATRLPDSRPFAFEKRQLPAFRKMAGFGLKEFLGFSRAALGRQVCAESWMRTGFGLSWLRLPCLTRSLTRLTAFSSTRSLVRMASTTTGSSTSGPGLLTILSPAKSLDFSGTSDLAGTPATTPSELEKADLVAAAMKAHSKASLGSTLGVSANLAALNHQRYQEVRLSNVPTFRPSPSQPNLKIKPIPSRILDPTA